MGSWGSCSSHCPGLPFPNTSSDPQATPLPAALFSHAKTGHELVSSCPPFLCSETNLAAYLIFSPLAGPIWIPASTNRSYWYCRAPTVSLRGRFPSFGMCLKLPSLWLRFSTLSLQCQGSASSQGLVHVHSSHTSFLPLISGIPHGTWLH